MKILFIAPLPPPIHGQSLISKILLEDLKKRHSVKVINMSKGISYEGIYSIKRLLVVIRIIRDVIKYQKFSDVIYLTISESRAGNIKDLLIYLVCSNRLSRIIIHLHGGSIKKELWRKKPILFKINKHFIRELGGVIISGISHKTIFRNMINNENIHIVPNFASEYMFTTKNAVINKYQITNPLRILYVSGLRNKKGYLDLYKSFFSLKESTRRNIRIDFAGAFETEEEKEKFLDSISGIEQMQYHGIVGQKEKRDLFLKSHIFCLPTKYYEGQPISILEAYASGCVVLTTGLGGIIDIFADTKNGYQIQANNSESISSKIEYCISMPEELKSIALENRNVALEKFKRKIYTSSIINVIETIKKISI